MSPFPAEMRESAPFVLFKPHVYKKAGFYRIALPARGALPAREYWYLDCKQVGIFLRAYWNSNNGI